MSVRDPNSPQWEDCKICGGDHWTKDHSTVPQGTLDYGKGYSDGYLAALANALATLAAPPRFRASDEAEWSRPGLTPEQVADYRNALLRARA